MKNILNKRHLALVISTLTLVPSAFGESETRTGKNSENRYSIGGFVEMKLADRVYQNRTKLSSSRSIRPGYVTPSLGWGTDNRQDMRFTIGRFKTEAARGSSKLLSLELWALPYRGSTSGFVKWAMVLWAPKAGKAKTLSSGTSRRRTVFGGLTNHFPAFVVFERNSQREWVHGVTRDLPGPLPSM